MGNKPIRLRGHHLETWYSNIPYNFAYLRWGRRKENGEEFSDKCVELFQKISRNPNLNMQVVVGLDYVCDLGCLAKSHYCISVLNGRDRKILKELGLEENGIYSSGYLLDLRSKSRFPKRE